jgi:hypothetical protein
MASVSSTQALPLSRLRDTCCWNDTDWKAALSSLRKTPTIESRVSSLWGNRRRGKRQTIDHLVLIVTKKAQDVTTGKKVKYQEG